MKPHRLLILDLQNGLFFPPQREDRMLNPGTQEKHLIQSHPEIDAAGIQCSGSCHASSLPLGGGLNVDIKSYQIYSISTSKTDPVLPFPISKLEVKATGQGTESLPSSSCTR